MSDLECPICFNSLWVVNTPCNHKICIQCLIKLRKDECPTCRQVISGTLPFEFKRIMTIYKPELDKKKININNYEDFPTL